MHNLVNLKKLFLSPFDLHLKLSQHFLLISYIPIQNKKVKKIALISILKSMKFVVRNGVYSSIEDVFIDITVATLC